MRLEKTKQFITNWLKEYAQQNQMKNLVIGVSGGIDSSLTSTLCAETDLKTIVISMPIHQKKNEIDNATTHMNWLKKHYKNIQCETIDLSNTFEMYKKVIPIKFHSELSLANTRARLRMMTLYQIAGQVKGLVVGTGNKIEDFGIGFFTKYGDGGVDISPIADLTKSEVKKLAVFCGIQNCILNATYTDGLWEDGRSDEEQIGATYKELEWAMNYKKGHKITKRKKEVLDIYNKLHQQNKHKITPIPVCNIPKVLKN